MSFYETRAEGSGYFHFERRTANAVSHFHSAPELLFAEREGTTVFFGGESRALKRGEGCFFDSFVPHAYQSTKEASAFVLLGEKNYFDRVFQSFQNKVPPSLFRFEDFSLLENLRAFCEEKGQNGGGRYAIEEGTICIVLGALANQTPFIDRKKDRQSALLCDVLSFAETHLQTDLSLQFIAKEFGYSHEHLSRLLNGQLGQNWTSYVGGLRARRAKRLMEEFPKRTVLEIAFDCGFDSANTFYRAYKKEFGVPPKQKR